MSISCDLQSSGVARISPEQRRIGECFLDGAASHSLQWNQLTETDDAACALSGFIFGAGKSLEIRLCLCLCGPPLFQVYMLVACC